MTKGVWSHVAAVKTATRVYVYINGILVYEKALLASVQSAGATGHNIMFGGDSGEGNYLAGTLDEVRVWNSALSAATIAAWRSRGADASHPNWANLVADYAMDETSGTSAADRRGVLGSATLLGTGYSWAPSTASLQYQTNQKAAVSGLLARYDADGGALTAAVAQQAANGTVTMTDPATAAFTYTPNVGFSGTDTFNYTIDDGTTTSAATTVTLTVVPTHLRVAAAQGSIAVGTAQNLTVTALDELGNTLTNYSGTVHLSSTDAAATLATDGTLTNGVGNFSVTLNTAGTGTITATDTATSTITGTSGVVTVTLANQTITFGTLGATTYGSADFTLSATASSGLAVTFSSQTTGRCTTAGTNGATVHSAAAGTCTIRATQEGSSNYNAASAIDQSFSITAKALTIATPAVTTKTYDKTAAATFTGTLSGLVTPDVVTLSGTGSFASVNQGSGLAVTSTATLGGADAGNYTLTQPTGLTGTITTRALTVTAATNTKVYDGTTSAVATPAITAGSLAAGDTATWTQTYDTKNAGTGKTLLVTAGSVSDGNGGGNYAVTLLTDTTGVITKAAATVALHDLTLAHTGSALKPTVTTTPSPLAIAWSNAPQTGAGTYAVTATVTDSNYEGTASGTFSIVMAPTLELPTLSNLGANLVTLNLQADATGTGYFTLLAGTTTPCGTGTQVRAGLDDQGAPAPYRGSLPLTANTQAHATVRNLTQDTDYRVCFTAAASVALQATPATAALSTAAMVHFTNPGWGPVGDAGFSPGGVADTTLAFAADGTPYVAYRDATKGDRASVMKYASGAWTAVGEAGVAVGAVTTPMLVIAPDATPYLAYTDGGAGNQVRVLRLAGSDWIGVGDAGSLGAGTHPSLAFGPDGRPYVAYQNGTAVTVMQFDGTDWVDLAAAFATGPASSLTLAMAPNGYPSVVFEDADTTNPANRATVMRYDGTGWAQVGTAGFSADTAIAPVLALAPHDAVYVAYQDGGTTPANRATVMLAQDSTWSAVGEPGFSADTADNLTLALAADGAPTVAYRDGSTSPANQARVMRFDGTTWATLGTTALSTGPAAFPALAFAPDGTAYVAYQDQARGNRATLMKQVELTGVTVGTHPEGRRFSVDGVAATNTRNYDWVPGSRHVIATTAAQAGDTGTRAVFATWSDGGALSHTVTVPATPTAYTADFTTQYQLTTAVSPTDAGYVLPPTGGWYATGSLVTVSVTPNTGAAFGNWTGAVANAAGVATTVSMTAPQSITANLGGSAALRAQITGRRGEAGARVWTITLSNKGSTTATNVGFTRLGLAVGTGSACNPVLKTALPTVADIAPGSSRIGSMTIDFSGCAASTKFTVDIGYRFDTTTGTNRYTNTLR